MNIVYNPIHRKYRYLLSDWLVHHIDEIFVIEPAVGGAMLVRAKLVRPSWDFAFGGLDFISYYYCLRKIDTHF